jgi:hypothetical protein
MDISINGKVDKLTGIFTLASDRDAQRLLAMEALHIVPHTPDKAFSLGSNANGTIGIMPFFGDLDTQREIITTKENYATGWGLKTPNIIRAP